MSNKKNTAANNVVQLECKNLHEYLKSQTQIISKLYDYPAICLAVFRDCIPAIAKQFVMRMLCVEQPVPQAVVQSWGSQVYAKYLSNLSFIFVVHHELKKIIKIMFPTEKILQHVRH